MAIEIERKFLVKNYPWTDKTPYLDIIQGYLNQDGHVKVRARWQRDSELHLEKGYITIKGPRRGISSSEYEYEIPAEEAAMIITDFAKHSISKRRYLLKHSNQLWQIDQFGWQNKGLCVAEIELESENTEIVLPDWVSHEVTPNSKYSNFNLAVNPYQLWQE